MNIDPFYLAETGPLFSVYFLDHACRNTGHEGIGRYHRSGRNDCPFRYHGPPSNDDVKADHGAHPNDRFILNFLPMNNRPMSQGHAIPDGQAPARFGMAKTPFLDSRLISHHDFSVIPTKNGAETNVTSVSYPHIPDHVGGIRHEGFIPNARSTIIKYIGRHAFNP